MMQNTPLRLKNIRIQDPESPFHSQTVDVAIAHGKIAEMGQHLFSESDLDTTSGWTMAPSVFDMQVSGGEPGHEERERFESLENAALAGGVTGLLLMPDFIPVTDNRSAAEALFRRTRSFSVQMLPAGCLSIGMKGKDLAEMADMHKAGVPAFCDDNKGISQSLLLHLAMQYQKVTGGLIMLNPEDPGMQWEGMVHEGHVNIHLGLKGQPDLAERIGIERALTLAHYHAQSIHLMGISSANSVARIRKAKAEGIAVSCSVYAHQLLFCDENLREFDTRFKVWPPLRSADDRDALIEGVLDGTIDVVCSDHRPWNDEQKDLEFGYAAFGTSGIQTLWNSVYEVLKGSDRWIEVLARNPRRLLGIKSPEIAPGADAEVLFYSTGSAWTFDLEHNRSLSKYAASLGSRYQAKIQCVSTPKGWQAAF